MGCVSHSSFCHCSGILVTGTVVLEALAQCGTAAFDKTGTLTTGRLAATSMRRPDTAAAANGAAPQHLGKSGRRAFMTQFPRMMWPSVTSGEPEMLTHWLSEASVLGCSPPSRNSKHRGRRLCPMRQCSAEEGEVLLRRALGAGGA